MLKEDKRNQIALNIKKRHTSPLVWVVLLFLFLVPCVLTILNYRPSLSIRSMSFLLGRLTGIIGLSSLTLTVVLSAKFSFLEDLFGGLDKVYQVHQSIGKMAFYNMLAHPLLLLVKYLPDDYLLALEYLFIGDDLSINFGVVAFWGFLILIIMTLAMKLKISYLENIPWLDDGAVPSSFSSCLCCARNHCF
jgi:predicted ferric reductase